jgi:hypothetical protein
MIGSKKDKDFYLKIRLIQRGLIMSIENQHDFFDEFERSLKTFSLQDHLVQKQHQGLYNEGENHVSVKWVTDKSIKSMLINGQSTESEYLREKSEKCFELVLFLDTFSFFQIKFFMHNSYFYDHEGKNFLNIQRFLEFCCNLPITRKFTLFFVLFFTLISNINVHQEYIEIKQVHTTKKIMVLQLND